jgi:hypothetical protein
MHPGTVSKRCRDYTKAAQITPGACTADAAGAAAKQLLAPQRRSAAAAGDPRRAQRRWPSYVATRAALQDASGAGIATTARIGLAGTTVSSLTKPYETVRASSAVS